VIFSDRTKADWGDGIPYLRYTLADPYAGGYRYNVNKNDRATFTASLKEDLAFHIDLQDTAATHGVLIYRK
jgi:hypothetical protein